MKKIIALLISCIALTFIESNGQTQVFDVGSYSQTNGTIPFATSAEYSRSKILYAREEIGVGTINSIGFKISSAQSSDDLSRIKVYLKETDITNFGSSETWNIQDFSLVFDGRIKFCDRDGWIYVDLQNSFTSTGENNLLVAIEYSKSYNMRNVVEWDVENTGDNYLTLEKSSNILPDQIDPISLRPLTRFVYNGFYSNPGMDIITTMDNVDIGSESPFVGEYGYSYVWKNSSDEQVGTSGTLNYTDRDNLTLSVFNESQEFSSSRIIRVYTGSFSEYSFTEDKKVVVDENCRFFDSGGRDGSYNNKEDYIVTFAPKASNYKLKLGFSGFDLETDCQKDYLEVYRGEGSNLTLIGKYCGTSLPGDIDNLDYGEPVTFIFHSDDETTGNGWDINITSVRQLDCIDYSGTASVTILGGNCTNRSISLSLSGNQGTFIRWEQSSDNVNFTQCGTTTNPTTLTGISTSKYYRAVTSDMNGGQCYSASVLYSSVCVDQTVNINCTKDACVISYPDMDNVNYGDYDKTMSNRWTADAIPLIARSFLEFDLSQIPEGAIIQSSELKLTGVQHYAYTVPNNSYIQVVSQAWQEYVITWNNQPTFTENLKKSVPGTPIGVMSTENRTIDVTDIVQSWVNKDITNNGFVLKLQDESTRYTRMSFASSDYPTPSYRPQLTVTYTPIPMLIVNTEALTQNIASGEQMKYRIYSTGIPSTIEDVEAEKRYLVFPPAQGNTSNIHISFFSTGSTTDSAEVVLSINYLSEIQSVKINNADVNPTYYKIVGNKIYFLSDNAFYEERQQLPVYPVLKDGLVLTPLSEEYNTLEIYGAKASKVYSLNIKDRYNNAIFSTTSKYVAWDGKTTFYNSNPEDPAKYVPQGTYTYEITVDGINVNGKFLVQY